MQLRSDLESGLEIPWGLKQQLRPSEARMIGVAPISVAFQTTARLPELHPDEGGDGGVPGTTVPTLPPKSSIMSNDMALTSAAF